MCIAKSFCCTVEMSTTGNQLYFNKIKKFFKVKRMSGT